MLFNSYTFIFLFFPIVFIGYFLFGKRSHLAAILWLVFASLFFYGWWDARYLWLLLCSIIFNYGFGIFIARDTFNTRKITLAVAIITNLVLLGYFKYANFFVDNLNSLTNNSLYVSEIVLPLGISFFTFTQIAFLVDTYHGKVKEFNFLYYVLFVTYFPHLIAGPVLHHKEMMPQFASSNVCHINWTNITVGLCIFIIGLAKKVLIADLFADFSSPVFKAVADGGQPMLWDAWIGALSYTFQLYFDFSAYSDMAVGISLMFNVRLPINFNSPYKSTSIVEFWRNWHMTLSRFLREYLYIPLGGSRHGSHYCNLMVTMLLGGFWHGAGWTFIVWGGLHGLYLIVNHAWRAFKEKVNWGDGGMLSKICAWLLMFISVVVGWVFFRADSISSAIIILGGMAGLNGFSLPEMLNKVALLKTVSLMLSGFLIVLGLPNVRQMFIRYKPTYDDVADETGRITLNRSYYHFEWMPSSIYALILAILFSLSIMGLTQVSEFLYFQF